MRYADQWSMARLRNSWHKTAADQVANHLTRWYCYLHGRRLYIPPQSVSSNRLRCYRSEDLLGLLEHGVIAIDEQTTARQS